MSDAESSLAALARKIIQAQGPIPLSVLMRLASTALPESYYHAQQPFGPAGDFVTSPEISQMFGEMLALALADQWQRVGAPSSVELLELGPGRGVLMADLLRTWRQVAPALLAAAKVTLVETSERLRREQAQTLQPYIGLTGGRIAWCDRLPAPGTPLLVVANEFFDALPMRQFRRTADGWCERLIAWSEERGFHDALGPPIPVAEEPDGNVWEHSAESEEWMTQIAARLSVDGGLALVIDYASRPGESSLRGIRRHRTAPPLQMSGKVDLSAGVDFCGLISVAQKHGAGTYGPVGQGDYLRALGIYERRARLAAGASTDVRRELDTAVERLTGAQDMGGAFRVLAVTGPDEPTPEGFGGREAQRQCS